jgi:hypothetical protein
MSQLYVKVYSRTRRGAARNGYTLVEFGLDLAGVREAYTERFGVRLEE